MVMAPGAAGTGLDQPSPGNQREYRTHHKLHADSAQPRKRGVGPERVGNAAAPRLDGVEVSGGRGRGEAPPRREHVGDHLQYRAELQHRTGQHDLPDRQQDAQQQG